MKWFTANRLSAWASERIDARTAFADLIQQLVRASVSDATAFRFPAADNAQMPGWDGRLIASVKGLYAAYVPNGESVWEWGVDRNYRSKAEHDWEARKNNSGAGVTPANNTYVFVTPHRWADKADWIADKLEQGSPWKDISVIDGEAIEEWAESCSAAAAASARQNRFVPNQGVDSLEEFWENYSARFEPKLTEAVVLAGRSEQSKTLLTALARNGPIRCKGDSLDEVIAFVAATIRAASPETRDFLSARMLLVQSAEAAKELAVQPHLAFIVRGAAGDAAGALSFEHPVIVPMGRDTNQAEQVISLVRPTFSEMADALRAMGLPEERAVRLPHECGRSVSILARRIPRAGVSHPAWSGDASLVPALLAGAWDRTSEGDREVLRLLSGAETYDRAEAALRRYVRIDEAPLETAGEVWAVTAPVDLYVNIDHLIGTEHWVHFGKVAETVFAEIDPAQEMPPEERVYAGLHGKVLSHSKWLRDGMATTLLIFAALSKQGTKLSDGRTAQKFVDDVIASIPGLNSDWRVIASLAGQLPMLMEASPGPLLSALEQLLEGDGKRLKPIFQDAKERPLLFGSSPHTGLLWALEVAGQDPNLLGRTADVLAKLAEIDPQGILSNRPSASLQQLFLAWKPRTNASLELRLSVIDHLVVDHPQQGWKLLLSLIPHDHEVSFGSIGPQFRDAGLSSREVITWGLIDRTVSEFVGRIAVLAGTSPQRWALLFDKMGSLDPRDRRKVVEAFDLSAQRMTESEQGEIWQPLAALIRRHKAHQEFKWTMAEEELRPLEAILARIAPQDQATLSRYLFQERIPDIPGVDIHGRWEKVEELRLDAVRQLFEADGVEAVVHFAGDVDSPRFVGAALGQIAPDVEIVIEAVLTGLRLNVNAGFLTSLSGAAYFTFRDQWMDRVEQAFRAGTLDESQLATLLDAWPNEPSTWRWLDKTGVDTLATFWSRHQAWGLKATGDELQFAITKYLEAERPEFIVDALGHEPSAITTELLIATLEAFEMRALKEPSLLYGDSMSYSLKLIFQELQRRSDAPLERVAVLEYRFLPVLRELLSSSDPNSALDRFLSESPEFFVTVISHVFRAKSEKDDAKKELSEGEQARARNSYLLLESFSRIPGREADEVDFEQLDHWVTGVSERAAHADRLKITEEFIGKLLVHAPVDPTDGIWPHRSIRHGLEKWRSAGIELGLHVGKMNARGPTSRGSYDGGAQERAIAAGYRAEAARLDRWPRTRSLLIGLAETYERSAEMMDMRVAQLRLRE